MEKTLITFLIYIGVAYGIDWALNKRREQLHKYDDHYAVRLDEDPVGQLVIHAYVWNTGRWNSYFASIGWQNRFNHEHEKWILLPGHKPKEDLILQFIRKHKEAINILPNPSKAHQQYHRMIWEL